MTRSVKNIAKAVLLVLPLLFYTCTTLINSAFTNPGSIPIILKVEKTNCFGHCKKYTAFIHKQNWIEYFPKNDTILKNGGYGKIEKQQYNDLIQAIDRINTDSIAQEYDNKLLMDAPSYILSFHKSDKIIKSRIRAGAPKELSVIIKKVEKIIKDTTMDRIP